MKSIELMALLCPEISPTLEPVSHRIAAPNLAVEESAWPNLQHRLCAIDIHMAENARAVLPADTKRTADLCNDADH